ncbi:Peptidyl-prolyl cis-trans isomerase FKBP8 [Lamellibrachia satsuma]|nr:Peptidyl-prolyl cis-trans isomerase FKBP8 [Lamellibrachia satsuma]
MSVSYATNFSEPRRGMWSLASSLLVINEGDGLDSRPQRGDIVTVRSTGYLDGGYQVDQHDEQTFILGDGDVIPALDLSVALMELHEICEVYTEAKYAYGERGREPDIPGDAAITYEVELLKVIGVPNFKSMSVSETIKFSDQKRQRGNFLYSRGEHSAAIMSYTKALQIIDANEMSLNAISPEEMKQLQDIRVKCFNNLAAAQLKMEAYDVAIKSCESVLREEPQNTKALFRKGKCLAGKGNLKEAIQYLRKALKLEPESKLIHQELSHLVSELKEQEQMSRLVFQRMMGTQNTGAAKRKIQTFPHWVMMIGGATIVAVISVGLAAYHYGSEKILGN